MIREIMRDLIFLGIKSEEATKDDMDMSWKRQKQKYSGFLAQIIQHECDHLEGIII